tara:strand:- start:634 stop:2544 length:1911 start_codon:yes stop_codon:yes gene_type:complete
MAGGFEEFVEKFREEQKSDTFTARTVGAAAVSEAMAAGIQTKVAGRTDVQSTTAANIAQEVSVLSERLKDATDGAEVKGIVDEMKSLKRVVDSFDPKALSDEGREDINKLLDTSITNAKASRKGTFGKAGQTLGEGAMAALNPLRAIGDFATNIPILGDTIGETFNVLADGLEGGIKDMLGIGLSKDETNQGIKLREAQDYDVREGGAEALDGGMPMGGDEGGFDVREILNPRPGYLLRMRKTLAFGLGLTSRSGESYLSKLVEFSKPKPASATEGKDKAPVAPIDTPEVAGEPEKKKGIMGMLSALGGAAAAGISGGITLISTAIRGLAMSVMTLAAPPALIGLGAITLALIGIGTALRIATPALKVFGDVVKKVAEVIGDTFLGAMERIPPIMESIGGIIESVGDAIGNVVSTVFDTLSSTLERLSALDGDGLLHAAAGIGAVALALAGFAVGGGVAAVVTGLGSLFGGGPLEQLEKLDGDNLMASAEGIKGVGEGLKQLDEDIKEFGKSNAPKILEEFTQSMEGFKDSMPGLVTLGKMKLFGLAFADLQDTAKDFVANMTIVANPVATQSTAGMIDAQRQVGNTTGASNNTANVVNAPVTNANKSIHNSYGKKPLNDVFLAYNAPFLPIGNRS